MINKNTKKRALIFGTAAAVIALGCAAMDARMKTVTYTINTDKLSAPVRLAVVSDLHSCAYGKDMKNLLDAVRAAKPDALLLPGDIYDDEIPEDNARIFARTIAAEIPTFYVTGNHEIASGRADQMKKELRSFGAVVLEGDAMPLAVRDQIIWIAGADDQHIGEEIAEKQRNDARAAVPDGAFSILLSHRPDLTEDYAALGFDAVIAGHAHGGQWRLPGLINGIYAPHQGFLPDYAGGMYYLGTTRLIVSRGLARETTLVPRIFNRPELVILEIK